MVLILDDHPLARQGICSMIQMYREEETILHAGTVRESITLMEGNEIDLAFVDINLGKENGFSFVMWVKEKKADTKIFIITSSSRQNDFKRAQEFEVDAYVLKDAFIDEILYGLKIVERGGRFYSATLYEQMNKVSNDEKIVNMLTEREMDVFLLIGQGYDNTQISSALFISEGTTKKHVTNILSKLDLQNNRVAAALLANKNSYCNQVALAKSFKPEMREEMIRDEKKQAFKH